MEITGKVISGEGKGESGGKGTGNKRHNWLVQNRHRLLIVGEMEKPKNLNVQPMDMN